MSGNGEFSLTVGAIIASMELDSDHCYRAVVARDSRFDGRFFVAVSSTRIYCRPICRVRTPRRENCRYYASAAAAEQHGYRPCLRCRPELAPGLSAVDASNRLAQAAARLIDTGEFERGGVQAVARRLGTTDRHLRRIFGQQFGVSPVEYAQTRRMLLAKQLLTDTGMPVIEVAAAAGFASLRRFNACFRDRYRLTPTQLRRRACAHPQDRLVFRLAFRQPYDWTHMLDFLQRRLIDGVESIEGNVYRRTVACRQAAPCDEAPAGVGALPAAVALPAAAMVPPSVPTAEAPAGAAAGEPAGAVTGSPARPIAGPLAVTSTATALGRHCGGWISVAPMPAAGDGQLGLLRVEISSALAGQLGEILQRVRWLFDLDCSPHEVAAGLGELASGSEGIRLPGAFDGFEMAVRAVIGQQITVKAARTLAGRFARRFGGPIDTPFGPAMLFPSPERIARAEPSEIAELGILATRSRTIIALARALAAGELRLDPTAAVEPTVQALRRLPGVGDWTAQYIAMRALAWPDAFPASDLVVMRALSVDKPTLASRLAECWQPWRGYAVMHLWRRAHAVDR